MEVLGVEGFGGGGRLGHRDSIQSTLVWEVSQAAKRGEIALLEGGAADFEGGGEEFVVDGPGLHGDDDEAKLFVVLEVCVDGVELGC